MLYGNDKRRKRYDVLVDPKIFSYPIECESMEVWVCSIEMKTNG